MLADLMVLVEKRHRFLPDELHSAEREFNRERFLVNRLKKPGPSSR